MPDVIEYNMKTKTLSQRAYTQDEVNDFKRIKEENKTSDRDKMLMESLPIMDQIDAILNGLKFINENGIELPDDLKGVINHWLSIKQKYPK